MNIPIDIDFTVDVGLWKRTITSETGKRILPEPAIRIFRGDKNFKIKVLKDGNVADLSNIVDFSLSMKSAGDLTTTLLAESSSYTLEDNVLEIVMNTATSEVDTFLGDSLEKSVALELNALDGQGNAVEGPLFHTIVKLRADSLKNDDETPSVSGNELGLGDIGNSLEIDFDGYTYLRGNADQTTLSISYINETTIPSQNTGTGQVRTIELALKNTSGSDCTVTLPTGVNLADDQTMDVIGGKDLTFADGKELLILSQSRSGKTFVDLSIYQEVT